MAKTTIAVVSVTFAFAIAGCDSKPPDQQRVWEDESGIVELVELSRSDQRALKVAPRTAMNQAPSVALGEAIRSDSIDSIKIQLVRDKVDGKVVDEVPPTYQGWIYYEPTKLPDGAPYAPAVLCVSQSMPIKWFHCQDASDDATMRLLEAQLKQP